MGEEEDEQSLGGGFDQDLMGEVVDDLVVATPTMDSTDPASMLRPLARFLAGKLQAIADGQEAFSLFLHSTYPDDDSARFPHADQHHHLARARKYDPFDRAHMVATGLDRALSMAMQCDDPEEVHAWLERHGLLDRPAAWFDAAQRIIVWYPNGFRDEKASTELEIARPGRIDGVAVDRALDIFHSKCTRVPLSNPKFWHSSGKRVPCERTEKRIQEAMQISLDTRFYFGRVDREVPLRGSEIDFVISEPVNGTMTPACALEVKVLREKHFSESAAAAAPCRASVNKAAVISGIRQAAVARDELGTALAYMAAFDMRATDSDDLIVSSRRTSRRLQVECRRYYMHKSKSSYRDAATAPRRARGGAVGRRTSTRGGGNRA